MPKSKRVVPALVVLAAIVGIAVWWHDRGRPVELALHFHPFVGAEPLVLNEARYPNPGGDGRFQVRDFQFFVSNVRLTGATGAYAETDSYHLVRFDGAEPGYRIVLHDVPRGEYQRIEFGVGVDGAANGSVVQRGDLDPNGRMAWTWEVGYKFVLFEGTLVRGSDTIPLIYHVGFDENYKVVSIELDDARAGIRSGRLDLRVDILRLFQDATTVDMATLPSVKFDRTDAARLARNFAAMITPMRGDAPGSH